MIYGQMMNDFSTDKFPKPNRNYGTLGNIMEMFPVTATSYDTTQNYRLRMGISVLRSFTNEMLDEIDQYNHGITIFTKQGGSIVTYDMTAAYAYASDVCKYIDPSILCIPEVQIAVMLITYFVGVRKHLKAFVDYDFYRRYETNHIHIFVMDYMKCFELGDSYHMRILDLNNAYLLRASIKACLYSYFTYGHHMNIPDVSLTKTSYVVSDKKTKEARWNLGLEEKEHTKKPEEKSNMNPHYLTDGSLLESFHDDIVIAKHPSQYLFLIVQPMYSVVLLMGATTISAPTVVPYAEGTDTNYIWFYLDIGYSSRRIQALMNLRMKPHKDPFVPAPKYTISLN